MLVKKIILLLSVSTGTLAQGGITLARCSASCAGGSVVMEFLCPEFVLPPVVAACYSIAIGLSTPLGQVACNNWCYWIVTQTLSSFTGQFEHRNIMIGNITEEMARELKLVDPQSSSTVLKAPSSAATAPADVSKKAAEMAWVAMDEWNDKIRDCEIKPDCQIQVICDLSGCKVVVSCNPR